MLRQGIRFFSLGFMLPLTFMVIMYLGASSAYTWGGYFTEKHFHSLYDNGIYKYRVLGKQSLLEFYKLTKSNKLPGFAPRTTTGAYKDVDKNLYAAYFYNNTLYLIIASCFLILIFSPHKAGFTQCELPILSILGLIGLTQYIVVPYDTLTYACLFAAIYLITTRPQNLLTGILLLATMVIATLTRESSVIILSFYAAWYWKKLWQNPLEGINKEQGILLALIVIFIATYLALRLQLGFSQGIFHQITITRNITLTFWFALLFFGSFLSLFFLDEKGSSVSKRFLVFAMPYIIMIIIVAIPQELRLWMPVVLPLIILKSLAGSSTEMNR